MNKAELIAALQPELDKHRELVSGSTSKKEVEKILEALACVATKALGADAGIDQEVPLPGLGKFKTTQRPARAGRNPKTGEPVLIGASIAVKFVPAKQLKDFLNP